MFILEVGHIKDNYSPESMNHSSGNLSINSKKDMMNLYKVCRMNKIQLINKELFQNTKEMKKLRKLKINLKKNKIELGNSFLEAAK